MKREKYKVKTSKGQKVYKIDLNIFSKDSKNYTGICYQEGLTIRTLKIVHQTKYKIALNDDWITLLDRQKETDKPETYKHFLGDVSISIKTKENYFPNGIFCVCYTTEDPAKIIQKIKSKMINRINKEYSFLRDIDLENKIYDMVAKFE